MEVLAISLGKNILKAESRDRVRMQQYAENIDGYHLIILTRRRDGYAEEVHEGNLHLYPTHSYTRLGMLFSAFWVARRTIRNKKTMWVVTAQDPLEIGWLSWFIARTTKAYLHIQVHGDYFSSAAWVGRSLFRYIRRFFALMLLRRAPLIRVVSNRIKSSLVTRGISGEKITVLPIRPELEAFLSYTHVVRDTPPYTFLFIGRLAPEKNISRIVRAFARVHREQSETHLRIVGEGRERERITGLIATLDITDAVTLLPWTDAVEKEMVKADVFLLASLHEAYALTLVEAMAVGLPLITTDVGCVGEVVLDGVHGLVVYEKNDRAYAEAMVRMMHDASFRIQCGKNGKYTAQALAEYSAEEYAQAWVTALKPVL